MTGNRGFTLIELMITIAVFALLLAIGAPLTRAWSDSAHQREAASLLQQGLSRAKATALRNVGGVLNPEPAAVLCHSGQTLMLFQLDKGQSVDCTAVKGSLWSAVLPGSASLQSQGSEMSCVAFDNRGLPVSGSSCATTTLQVLAGNESALDVQLI